MKKQSVVIVSIVILVLIFVLASYVYKNKQSEKLGFLAQENADAMIRDHSPIMGNRNAKVFLIEFLDPACETCRTFHPYVQHLMASNPGRIQRVIRYAPFHQGSDQLVKILEASKNQGKYWETLDAMFESQPYWASHHNPQPQLVWQHLEKTGLDLDQVRRDMNAPEIAKRVEQDITDANTLSVRKTPGFFVNGKPLVTFGGEQLKALLEEEIRLQYPG